MVTGRTVQLCHRAAVVEVTIAGVAAGGDGVGRLPDGRAVFVRTAIPGDRVDVEVYEEKARFARGRVVDVVQPGPGRVVPPCPHQDEGCGGCGWQHVGHATQRLLKAKVVTDALVRIGRLDPGGLPAIDPGPDLPGLAHRSTVRAAIDTEGRAGLRTHHGHDVVPFGNLGCPVAHPLVDEILRRGSFEGAGEVVVRCGVGTGERLLLVHPKVPVGLSGVPSDVVVVGADELAGGRRVWLHEVVRGRRWRISAGSFFQSRPDGAAALVDQVGKALRPAIHRAGNRRFRVIDLYAGVGLFAGALADRFGCRPVAVESSRSAAADARVNLGDFDSARIIATDVRRWRPAHADAVVADPSRHGLGAAVVQRIAATGASDVVLVSCDPGALGRDAGLLAAAGYRLRATTLVDLFPNTPHVEVVTAWNRTNGHPRPAAAT
jgi:23S rRNA (uracil1939-C5)-methyltransferase